jgi:hydrogenase/urease accessory protein HupE
VLALAAVLLGLLCPTPVAAHEFRPAVLALDEVEPGTFAWVWQPPRDAARRDIAVMQPRFPAACEVQGQRLRCGDAGLQGVIAIEGLAEHPVDVIVRIHWLDGSSRTAVLRGSDDRLELRSTGPWQVFRDYTLLGVEHILGGIDHLLFVVGLVVLVGFRHKLLWTITGFTLAHSLTLAGSVLGLVRLPQAPVEAVIALSILLMAVEIADDRPSLSRRFPAVVAFAFGLLHGFGFAGALTEIGLPTGQLALALLAFNVGVELGQLGVVAGLFAVARLVPVPERYQRRVQLAIAYGLGTMAAFWTIERVVGFWG